MKSYSFRYVLTILTLLCVVNHLNFQKLPKEESFRKDSQKKSFSLNIIDLLPMPHNQEEFWLVTQTSIDHFNLQTGEILSRFPVQSIVHCVRETKDKKYMIYNLDPLNRKLYGFNLRNGEFEADLRLPDIQNESEWFEIQKMNCLEEGIEIKFSKNKFVFFKDYQDVKVSIGSESVHDLNEKLIKKELYKLSKNKDNNERKPHYLSNFKIKI